MNLTKAHKFLGSLASNNNKEWMDAHRDEYQKARDEFIAFIDSLIQGLSATDPELAGVSAKSCIFRINRDIRFSKDKSPYKTNFGASIGPGGRHSSASYYFHLTPGNNFIGGGIYMPPADVLKKIRQEIDYNAGDLKKILQDPSFKKAYGDLHEVDKLKTAPKGYPKDHPEIELLKHKSFIVLHQVTDHEATKEGFEKEALEYLKIMKPFRDYLRVATSD